MADEDSKMTKDEFLEMLRENNYAMNGFGHYVKGDKVIRFRGDEVNFGKGWLKLSKMKKVNNKKVVWNVR